MGSDAVSRENRVRIELNRRTPSWHYKDYLVWESRLPISSQKYSGRVSKGAAQEGGLSFSLHNSSLDQPSIPTAHAPEIKTILSRQGLV